MDDNMQELIDDLKGIIEDYRAQGGSDEQVAEAVRIFLKALGSLKEGETAEEAVDRVKRSELN
jgi:hypothetical protein